MSILNKLYGILSEVKNDIHIRLRNTYVKDEDLNRNISSILPERTN